MRRDSTYYRSPIRRIAAVLASVLICALSLVVAGCATLGASPVCLAGAKLDARGTCRAQQAPLHHIPFREGFKTRIMQGYHGYLSHKEDLAHSLDFRCELGTPVVASKAGRVWATRDDSNRGCADMSCVEDANYVVLDHGDGTYSEYYHLAQFGALVELGENVCAGEVIGLCGSTGFATGEHLHYALTNTTRQTLPTRFYEAAEKQDIGLAVPETEYVSANELQTQCAPTPYSQLSRAAFAHQGITLEKPLPLVIEDRPADKDDDGFHLQGVYHGDHPNVAVHRKAIDGDDWTDECVPVDANGRFSARIKWPKHRFEPGGYWFMLTGADEDCLAPGWAWSYRVNILEAAR
ncbi:hypothetical protein DN745_08175 [Bradymonas sediminis]|uniref:M23ase beta-sheet core domain-containing protein n=1 Tax=Bradymonas sediminis TaxID=1548548 RepID=A0A2Z4FKJ5_9DELT|nr:hypothetical protein DN745_08175 [Bradymonas sediminis]